MTWEMEDGVKDSKTPAVGSLPQRLKAGKPHVVPLSPNTIHYRPGQKC